LNGEFSIETLVFACEEVAARSVKLTAGFR